MWRRHVTMAAFGSPAHGDVRQPHACMHACTHACKFVCLYASMSVKLLGIRDAAKSRGHEGVYSYAANEGSCGYSVMQIGTPICVPALRKQTVKVSVTEADFMKVERRRCHKQLQEG